MKGRRIWIVSHCEVYLQPGDYGVDETVLFLASSKAKALRLMRASWVEPGSWWRLESGRLDDLEGRFPGTALYSQTGRLLKSAPVQAGYRAAISRYRRNLERLRVRLAEVRREGGAKRHVDFLREAMRSLGSSLRGHS
jgi:hypothetical protein